jgi:hypothetical protein
MATLEERVDELEALYESLNKTVEDFEKELAITKGRTDGLESKVGELEANQGTPFISSLLVINTYDVNTGEITKSVKPQSTSDGPGNSKLFRNRLSSDNFAALVMFQDAIILDNDVNDGVYQTKSIRHYGDTSVTGQDLVLGGSELSTNHYLSFGCLPTPNGKKLIINKQKV